MFFFFKQKTAYELRISDWSSDVCSSDLRRAPSPATPLTRRASADVEACSPAPRRRKGSTGGGDHRPWQPLQAQPGCRAYPRQEGGRRAQHPDLLEEGHGG